jgi:hypothetical protein
MSKQGKSAGEMTGEPGSGQRERGRRRKGMCLEDRPIREPNAAGIDIGAREIFVAVPSDRDETPVRVFPTFTEDLEEMARWLVKCDITTVAMESTGVYLDSALRCAGAAWADALPGRHARDVKRAGPSNRFRNQLTFRNSSRSLPWKLSTYPFCAGFSPLARHSPRQRSRRCGLS